MPTNFFCVNLPIPAAARYTAEGHPNPPQPTIRTDVLPNDICPVNI